MTADLVVVEHHDDVLLVRINRPHKRNAIDHDVTVAIDAALNRLEDEDGLRVGVLTGGDAVFSAGSDMYDARDRFTARGGEYGLLRRTRRKPLIAAVEGAALGGGFEIVLSCDLVVAARDAVFGLPETLRGLAATGGGVFRAPAALPPNVAAELLLTGATLDADRACQLGLVNQVVAAGEAVTAALSMARRICDSSPQAIAETLTALRRMAAERDKLGWAVTSDMRAAILASPDADEGRRAFAERRAPSWTVHE